MNAFTDSTAMAIQLQLFHRALLRTPVFSISDQLSVRLEELKKIIGEATPDFYNTIAQLGPDELCALSSKRNFTVWKYFNRSRFRPVPFGSFASVSCVPVTSGKGNSHVVLQEKAELDIFRDWDDQNEYLFREGEAITRAAFLVANSTLYRTGNEYRYICQQGNHSCLEVIAAFPELESIITYCSSRQSIAAMLRYTLKELGLSHRAGQNLLRRLIENQILWTDCLPNLIGTEYFKRIGAGHLQPHQRQYIISRRPCLSGHLSASTWQSLPELINWLNRHLPAPQHPQLAGFRSAFLRRFDRQSIPLSIALDPELGIGYAELGTAENSGHHNAWAQIFESRPHVPSPVVLTPLLHFLINRSAGRQSVSLEDFDQVSSGEPLQLPNTFSVLCRTFSDMQVIDQIGGCTANALLGRFSLNNATVTEMGKELAELEQQANPDVIFFDVSYPAEKHVDNISRRELLFAQELPLFSWSLTDCPLRMDDIEVRVQGSEIVLFSRRLGKRLVPRLATAYNYTRSDLPLFRFLSELQHQGLRSGLTLQFRQICPGWDHYPRLVYKNFILSPESWRLPDTLRHVPGQDTTFSDRELLTWLMQCNIPGRRFRCGSGDQTLVFDPRIPEDLQAFRLYTAQKTVDSLYIEEALIEEEPAVVNSNGGGYAAQVLLSCHHQAQVYSPSLRIVDDEKAPGRRLLPGGEWLYVEVYCHPGRADRILLEHITPVLKANRKKIRQWFFIRYREHGYHLRVRIQLQEAAANGLLLTKMHQAIAPLLLSGLVTDFQVKTYMRELERYGPEKIEPAERWFCRDSGHVIGLLASHPSTDDLYRHALGYMDWLMQTAFPKEEDRLALAAKMAGLFASEFRFEPGAYKLINRAYEKFCSNDFQPRSSVTLFYRTSTPLLTDLLRDTPSGQVQNLAADLLHMHINRLFVDEQRRHEAILYQYLFKNMKKLQKQSKPERAG